MQRKRVSVAGPSTVLKNFKELMSLLSNSSAQSREELRWWISTTLTIFQHETHYVTISAFQCLHYMYPFQNFF